VLTLVSAWSVLRLFPTAGSTPNGAAFVHFGLRGANEIELSQV